MAKKTAKNDRRAVVDDIRRRYCTGVSGAALKQFMVDYPYTDSPEPIAM